MNRIGKQFQFINGKTERIKFYLEIKNFSFKNKTEIENEKNELKKIKEKKSS